MTLDEAKRLLDEYKTKHPTDSVNFGIALGDAVEGLLAGAWSPGEVEAKFKSWAQLEWAGRVFDREIGRIRDQKAACDAVITVLMHLADFLIARAKGGVA